MKANKYIILVKYTFEIISAINVPKFVVISQILLKFGQFFFWFSALFFA